MRLSAFLRRVAAGSAALFPALAFAHPGHDGGHDLTWDFAREVVHRLGSPYHLAPLLAAAAILLLVMRWAKARRSSAPASRARPTAAK